MANEKHMSQEEAERAIQELFRERSPYIDLQWPKVLLDGRFYPKDLREIARLMEAAQEES
jgi:hypothetical protein